MRKSIRCFISCIIPFGALDVVRIVHTNGRLQELSGTVKAEEIMKLYPKHVLKKPSFDDELCRGIVVVPPEAELRRGEIYFLMPMPPEKTGSTRRRKKENRRRYSDGDIPVQRLFLADECNIMSEQISSHRRRRVGVWRPRLDSICETP